jgi:uncharacterized phiE125 gp8 family phage protein
VKVSTSQITEITPPTAEPVSRIEAKLHGRVTWTKEDSVIDIYIAAARRYLENYTQQSFVQRTLRAEIPRFADAIVLPLRPIASITSIKYYTTDSPQVLTTLSDTGSPTTSSEVFDLVHNVIVRNQGQTWPTTANRPDAVQIDYVAGYATVPEDVKACIFLLLQDLYENREAQIVGTITQRNKTVDMLMQSRRVFL